MKDDEVTPLSLLMPPFLCRCSPLLLPVPYPTCSRRYCCPLERVCVYLSSAATSILVKPLAFFMFPRYLSPCTAHPPPSHIRHPSISSSLRFVPHTQYFIPTPPSTPSLSISLLYISIYLSIYLSPLIHFLSPLSLNNSMSPYIYPQRFSILASY